MVLKAKNVAEEEDIVVFEEVVHVTESTKWKSRWRGLWYCTTTATSQEEEDYSKQKKITMQIWFHGYRYGN